MRDHGDQCGGSRKPAARNLSAAFFLASLLFASPLSAQGTATAPYSRGRPLGDWITQAGHYIPELRREAVKAIGALGPGARSAVPVLIRATRDENSEVRYWAVDALRRIGPAASDAAPALVVVMAEDERATQLSARRSLEMMGTAAIPSLVPLLESPDPWVRASAAEVLGGIGGERSEVIRGLASLLKDDSLWVRSSAAWGLGRIGRPARQAAKPLQEALAEELRRDPSLADATQRVRVENLVYAIGRMGDASKNAVPSLMSVLFDGSDSLRISAALALAGVGKSSAQPLGAAVRSGRPDAVRLEAAHALRLLGPQGKGAVKDLVKALESTDELEGGRDLLIATADALGAMGKNAKPALSALEQQRKRSATPDAVAALDRAVRKIRTGG
ncbi:MAG TPA: HEAT repeat domain-containing protein [Gemmatimonadales bacterium]|nr:HEAT repeat domain-containing protein [Gemmatimonadales bacterium]